MQAQEGRDEIPDNEGNSREEIDSMTKLRRLLPALALLAIVGPAAGNARAANISMIIDLSAGPSIIVDVFTTGGTSTDYGTVNLALVNASLAARGSAYQFSALGGQSNFGGTSVQGQLSLSGGVQISGIGAGFDTVLKITESETLFIAPTGPVGTLLSSSTGNFTNEVAGGGHTASSALNAVSTPTYAVLSSSGVLPNPQGGSSIKDTGPVSTLYTLTNVITFGLTPQPGLNVVDSFGVSAVIDPLAIVPEPSTLVLAAMGGIALLGYGWRRRNRA
jgi:hypothetical protein